jgi:protein-S-isoprenylcysteine O-methyltransferase Ste14
MTLITFNTSPVFGFNIGNLNGYSVLLFIWIGEVIAYIVLGKIEEIALKAKYRDQFLKYASDVPFMIPFLKLKRNEIKKNN